MATVSNRPLYRKQLPHSIQEKLALITVFQDLISNLETQLQNIRKEHARLEADIEPYRIRNEPDISIITSRAALPPTTSIQPPISRCPNEVLYLIFEEYIAKDHRQIAKLLFVCRRWNSIVMHSPSLWAKIHVPYALDFFRESERTTAISYVSTCLTRSRDVLLDVDLRLEMLPYHSGYIASQLEDRAMQVVEEDDLEDILDHIGSNQWDYKPIGYDLLFEQFVDCIFGVDGSNALRWASLYLILPFEPEAAINVWKRLKSPLSNLKRVVVDEVPAEVCISPAFTPLKLPLTESLTIRLDSRPVPLEIFQVSQDILTHLDLDFDQRLQNLSAISSLTSLKKLELVGRKVHYDQDGWEPPDSAKWPICTIRLQNLTKFKLSGVYEPLQAMRFEFPTLEKLKLCSTDAFYTPPTLSPRRIHWKIGDYWEKKWEATKIYAALNSLISLSPTLIIIPESAKSTGLSNATLGHQDEIIPTSDVKFYTKRTDGHIEKLSEENTSMLLALAKSS